MEKVVFLDRDGVINRYPGNRDYVKSWKEFCFLPRSLEAIRLLKEHNYKLFVISNQSGIGKGIYSLEALNTITANMFKKIREFGADIDGIYYCIHKPEDNCDCRKPRLGLPLRVLASLDAQPYPCIFIGDSFTDIQTALNLSYYLKEDKILFRESVNIDFFFSSETKEETELNFSKNKEDIKRSFACLPILVLSGRERLDNKENWPFVPPLVFQDIKEAAEYICAYYE